ncbi:MAG: GIN domain-containing protein [Flavobacteriaceae bacterium]|jgi:hypothetical protein
MKKAGLLIIFFITTVLSAQTKQKFLIAGDNNLSEIVKTEKLKVTIAGDGKFIGSGEAKNVTIRVVGDGVCDLSNIKTYSANIKIIGDGIVIINTHKLKAKMIGDGTIRTIRNPTFTKNFIIGDGRVIANNDDL